MSRASGSKTEIEQRGDGWMDGWMDVGPFGKNREAKKQIETVARGSIHYICCVTIALRVADDARVQLKRSRAIKYA